MEKSFILYSYFRSSAAYRVRLALNLKRISYEQRPVNLLKNEHKSSAYLEINQQGFVPTLIVNGKVLTQSFAILEFLEETYPEPPLLPREFAGRARVRAIAHLVASDIHTLNNVRVKNYFTKTLGHTTKQWIAWYGHWIHAGLKPLETQLATQKETGTFCHGETPTLADICLIPQVYNANRFKIDLSQYPIIRRINETCLRLEAFRNASPENQPDAPQKKVR